MYNKIVLFCSFKGRKKKSRLQFFGAPAFIVVYSSVSLDTSESLHEIHAVNIKSLEWHTHAAEDTLVLRCSRRWHCGNIKIDSN